MAKILVADDEHQILDVILEILEGAGHEVVGVADGVQALNLLKTTPFDLAIIDVMMPKMDGYHLVIKIHGLINPPKILIISSRHYENDESTLKSIGISAFLPKPFTHKDLLEAVRRILV